MRAVLLSAIVALTGLSACSDDLRSCQSACQKAYRSEQCNLQVPGESQSDLIRDCERECQVALRQTGELEGYDPDDYNSVNRSEPFILQNEKQAAVWMDCVIESDCESLNEGFCPGGGIN